MIAHISEVVLIEYQNLAAEIQIAESQKDVIYEALRLVLGDKNSIVEKSDGNFKDYFNADNVVQYQVKCISCFAGDTYEIDKSSILTSKNKDNIEVKFLATNRLGSPKKWAVNIIPMVKSYFIAANSKLAANSVLSKDDLNIVLCEAKSFCDLANSYSVKGQAEIILERFVGLSTLGSVEYLKPITKNMLKQTELISSGENVRVVYATSSGFRIETWGKALKAGAKNALIPVELVAFKKENNNTRQIISATVKSAGEVSYER